MLDEAEQNKQHTTKQTKQNETIMNKTNRGDITEQQDKVG